MTWSGRLSGFSPAASGPAGYGMIRQTLPASATLVNARHAIPRALAAAGAV
jgi:hypothetical protein